MLRLGLVYPQSWLGEAYGGEVDEASVGVELLTPIDPYKQSVRSLKYTLLFVGKTFGAICLFEVLGRARLHVIHYALIGAVICLFYLLELAISEHIGFPSSYVIAAVLVVVANGVSARSVLPMGRAALLTVSMCALYGKHVPAPAN